MPGHLRGRFHQRAQGRATPRPATRRARKPQFIISDNSPEFISKALDRWAYETDVKLHFIRPVKPVENAFIERFNGRFRDECLDQHWFSDLADARPTIAAWRDDYNHVRPHGSLGGLDHSTFSFNRKRLMNAEVAQHFFGAVVGYAQAQGLMSAEHFSVDGTLVEAWASLKSFRPRDEKPEERLVPDDAGNPSVDFHGEKRSNETHVSRTDSEAKLATKAAGQTAKLSYSLNGVTENKNGLLVALCLMAATGTAERYAATRMVFEMGGQQRITVGGDKGYDTRDFVADMRFLNVTPHVAQRKHSAIDGRTTSPPGYAVSQRKRKLIEEVWGWMKSVGGMRKSRYIGQAKTQMQSLLVGTAYNLLRIAKLLAP